MSGLVQSIYTQVSRLPQISGLNVVRASGLGIMALSVENAIQQIRGKQFGENIHNTPRTYVVITLQNLTVAGMAAHLKLGKASYCLLTSSFLLRMFQITVTHNEVVKEAIGEKKADKLALAISQQPFIFELSFLSSYLGFYSMLAVLGLDARRMVAGAMAGRMGSELLSNAAFMVPAILASQTNSGAKELTWQAYKPTI